MIPRIFIKDLIVKSDLVQIIGRYIKLKAQGGKYVGLCPFHQEKTPSFIVNPKEQFYYCFGCHAYGNALDFLMRYEHLDFKTAIANLAEHLNLPLPTTQSNPQFQKEEDQKNFLIKLHTLLTNFFCEQLKKYPLAQRYLQQRAIKENIQKTFLIGYAPQENYLQRFPTQYHKAWLAAGLIKRESNYPRFYQRIIFPIRNESGKIIALGGRVLQGNQVKYLNSPESMIFHKREELYGLYEAKEAGRLEEIIVVEGYLDVISLAQYNITNVVATLGTAITTRQVKKILRYSNKLVFCFDGDLAGEKGAERAMKLLLPLMQEGFESDFIFLPKGEDPDSFIHKLGEIKFRQYLDTNRVNLTTFTLQVMKRNCDLGIPEGKVKFINQAKVLLESIPNGFFKDFLLENIAKVVNLSPETFVLNLQEKNPSINSTPHKVEENNLPITKEQERILKLLIYYPRILTKLEVRVTNYLYDLKNPIFKEILIFIEQNPLGTVGTFLEHWREKKFNLSNILSKPLLNEEQAVNEINELVNREINHKDTKAIANLLQQLTHSKDEAERIILQKMIRDLKIGKT